MLPPSLHHLEMEAQRTSETLETYHNTTRRHNPENNDLNNLYVIFPSSTVPTWRPYSILKYCTERGNLINVNFKYKITGKVLSVLNKAPPHEDVSIP
jgi:hypothetical protein